MDTDDVEEAHTFRYPAVTQRDEPLVGSLDVRFGVVHFIGEVCP